MKRYWLLGLVVGCGTAANARFDDGGKNDTSGLDGGDPARTDASFSGDSAVGDDCSEAAKLVYLFTQTAELYSFDPPSKTLTSLGQLSCATTASPNSMAVARDGNAYVNYADGTIFKVDVKTLKCSATSFTSSWTQMGMGFSTNGTTNKDETLFVAKTTILGQTSELASVPLPPAALKPVQKFASAFANLSPELTGTGDGKLYAFFVDSNFGTAAKLVEISKTDATAVGTVTLSQITTVGAWAFSFWGGDFYLYYASATGNSKVGRYRPSDKSFVEYMTTSMRIVGAGVSTCAPITPR